MAVYVDESFEYRSGWWCHMIADTPEELHAAAAAIGLKREWQQIGGSTNILHYDLRPSKRVLAIKNGAVKVSRRELVEICKRLPPTKTYKVTAQFLDNGSRKELAGGMSLEKAINHCEYQAASLAERFDFIVVRAGNEWLASTNRDDARSYIFWISEEKETNQ